MVSNFFERLYRGFGIVLQTLQLLIAHAQLWAFIVGTTALKIILLITFIPALRHPVTILSFIMNKTGENSYEGKLSKPQFGVFIAVLLMSFALFPIINALVSFLLTRYTAALLKREPTSFSESFLYSLRRLPGVLFWILANAVMTVIVTIMRSKITINNNDGHSIDLSHVARSSLFATASAGAASIIEFSWKIATFLVIPIMALGKKSVISSVRESYKLMKDCYTDSTVALFSLRALRYILTLPLFSLVYLAYKTATSEYLPSTDQYLFVLNPWVIGCMVALFIFIREFIRCAQLLFRTAIYLHAHGEPLAYFNQQLTPLS